MLTLTDKIEFFKFLKENFLGKYLKSIEVFCVVECLSDFGIVTNIDIAEDKVSVWNSDGEVFWINLNDIVNVNYKPREEDVCLQIEALNEVKVQFSVE